MPDDPPLPHRGTALTRFNAVRHGILSRYTVLPYESEGEYVALLEALVAEHRPDGPTEEHLVEEIAGVIWRKARLRIVEDDFYRGGTEPYQIEKFQRYEVHLDRKLERVLSMLIRLQELRRTTTSE